MSEHLIIPIVPYLLGKTPARCYNHGQHDLVGYVATYSHVSKNGDVSFEDIAYVEGPTNYGLALDRVYAAREKIFSGEKDAAYAIVHHIYEVDGIKHRHI